MSFVLKQLKNNRLKIEKGSEDPFIEYECVGGKINNHTLKHMINNGYEDQPTKIDNIDGYVIDRDLSGKRAQVYYNPTTGHLVVNHRGTKGLQDVMTDIGLMVGHKSGKRFEHGKKITDQALNKYNTDNVTISGHSLGAKIAKESNRTHGKEMVAVNPAVVLDDIMEQQGKSDYVVRSSLDPISGLHAFNPYANEARTIDIPFQSYNPFTEHNADVLDRLGDVDIGK